jgi:hypothetical protein
MFLTPHRARVVRRVKVAPGSSVVVTDAAEQWFPCEVVAPDETTEAFSEGSPRERPAWVLRWPPGTLGPGSRAPVRPGERVEVQDSVLELLGLARQYYTGRRVAGHEVAVQRTDVLYPFSGALQEQGGEPVLPEINFALWSPADERADHGQYSTFQAEAPAEFYEDLRIKNRQIVLNDTTFRIVDPFFVLQSPRVRFVLRGAR